MFTDGPSRRTHSASNSPAMMYVNHLQKRTIDCQVTVMSNYTITWIMRTYYYITSCKNKKWCIFLCKISWIFFYVPSLVSGSRVHHQSESNGLVYLCPRNFEVKPKAPACTRFIRRMFFTVSTLHELANHIQKATTTFNRMLGITNILSYVLLPIPDDNTVITFLDKLYCCSNVAFACAK